MKRIILIIAILLGCSVSASATAFTSSQTGPWSSSSTWGGSGPPASGDTVSIGAHTVTVDVNTTVGTSPNDSTTGAVSVAATGTLVIGAGVTLTVRGNYLITNGAITTLNAGAQMVFDNAASGGTPVYKFVGGGIYKLNLNGSIGSRCGISAISGQTWSWHNLSWSQIAAAYADITRCAVSIINGFASGANSIVFEYCTWESSGRVIFASTSTAGTLILRGCRTQNTAGVDESFNIQFSATFTSGTRLIERCVLDRYLSYNAKGFTLQDNYFSGGINCGVGNSWSFYRRNFSRQDGLLNGGNGALTTASVERSYWVVENSTGNPHFIAPTALLGSDNLVNQNIFEARSADLVDYGDCLLVKDTACSGGNKIVGRNNIVLADSYPSVSVSSGCLLTLYAAPASSVTQFTHNTGNVNNSVAGGVGKRGLFAVAESGTGTAAQVEILKSNLAWGSSASQGYLGERVTGNVKDIITAANADKNWIYNTSAGDNQRGYEDRAASNTLWTAGDAVAAGADVNQGSGDPQFYDTSRNLATCEAARGYVAGDYAAALTALQADPTRTADLIAYVFEGFRVQNASMRNAAHDGGCVGAANFYKARQTALVTAHQANLVKFGL